MNRVLVVDDKQMMRDSVTATLARAGMTPVAADSAETALPMIRRCRPGAVVTDLKMPGMDGLELLEAAQGIDPQLPVILMTAFATVETAVSALKRGAFDYIQKPFEGDELVVTVKRAVRQRELETQNEALRRSDDGRVKREMIGESEPMSRVRRQIEQIAPSHGTVLISGESGTGKELVAQAIHGASPREEQVMLCLNCAALTTSLLESELFGHEKGAFTGADQMRRGRFELADGGTLLLDEISEIGPEVQAKLLRVLQERQFERVGASSTMETDVRIIATTNRDLQKEVLEGKFRRDLYYRLNVLPIALPALRERADDIPLIAEHLLARAAMRDGRDVKRFDEGAIRLLCGYEWPGNVRELENVCERAAVLSAGRVIRGSVIEPWLRVGREGMEPMGEDVPLEAQVASGKKLEDIERELILKTLSRNNGHRARTASALGIGVRTLGLKLKKWKELELAPSTA